MLSLLALGVLLAAAPKPVSIAAPAFSVIDVEPTRAEFYSERLAQAMGEHGLRVVTAKEIQALLGLERQKELLGCADASNSCTAELAGALGVDAMLLGSLAHIEGLYQLDTKILFSKDGRKIASYSARVESERALLDKIDEAARVLSGQLNAAGGTIGSPVAETSAVPPGTRRHWSWIPLLAGGALLGASSAYFYGQAGAAENELRSAATLGLQRAEQLRRDGNTAQTVGGAMLGASVAAIAAGAAVFWLTAESGDGLQVALAPGGVSVRSSF